MEHVRWKKSSKSGGDNGQCVELAVPDHRLLVRDSKNPEGAALDFSGAALNALLVAAKAGRLGA
jgi:hypothetical protein